MKHLVICNIVLLVISYVESIKNDYEFYPNLPTGEYRVHCKAIMFCNSTRNTDVQGNFYLNKKTKNKTELKGNITLKIPFDDSLTMDINFAVKDSIGGWKDNAFLFRSKNCCSTVIQVLGKDWPRFINNFGVKNASCPIPPGVYVLKGYDLTNIGESWNLSKIFFYGTYKMRIYFIDKNNNYITCIMFIIDVKRPWETE